MRMMRVRWKRRRRGRRRRGRRRRQAERLRLRWTISIERGVPGTPSAWRACLFVCAGSSSLFLQTKEVVCARAVGGGAILGAVQWYVRTVRQHARVRWRRTIERGPCL